MDGPPDIGTTSEKPARGSGGGLWMTALLVVTAGVIGFRYLTQLNDPAFAKLDGGAGQPQGQKLVLLMFTADWCGPCKVFKTYVLSNPKVKSKVERSCPLVKVDMTAKDRQSAEVAQQYGVQAIPTLILTDAKGREVARYDGMTDPQHFLRWLDRHAK